MSKQQDDAPAGMAIAALVGLVVAAAVAVYGIGKLIWWGVQFYRNRNKKTTLSQTSIQQDVRCHSAGSGAPWLDHCIEIEDAWNRGDYDWARQQLQRIAYTMIEPSVKAEEKMRFTQLMTEFAKDDPLYNDVMQRAMPMITANPGMVQSQIYKGQPEHIKEQMRYVLYFAHELGHIRREKNGNSYKLYLPEIKEMYGNKFIEVKRDNGIVTVETEPKKIAETGGITIMSNFVINKDEETAALHREATRLRDAGDLNNAIVALQKAQERMRKSNFSHTAESWVRLPLFLQQAGRFNEAELEFQRLLDDLPDLARREAGIGDRSVIYGKGTSKRSICNLIIKTHKEVINEKWALARKREERRLAKESKKEGKAT